MLGEKHRTFSQKTSMFSMKKFDVFRPKVRCFGLISSIFFLPNIELLGLLPIPPHTQHVAMADEMTNKPCIVPLDALMKVSIHEVILDIFLEGFGDLRKSSIFATDLGEIPQVSKTCSGSGVIGSHVRLRI